MMRTRHPRLAPLQAFALLTTLGFFQPASANLMSTDLADLSLEELANVQVTSVTGRPQALRIAAASVFVITGEDLRRSTATNLPEALRLAPNLQVARVNAGQYAISVRGFNNAIGNKLLVLVDGRTIYSPLFSGVFWDTHDVPLELIDRIEVISGPGGTVWGANAVNGVINIITKPAAQTAGASATVSAGRDGWRANASYGASAGAAGDWRAYATRIGRDETADAAGLPARDPESHRQFGFRGDLEPGLGRVTLSGDLYDGGGAGERNAAPVLRGGNVRARWQFERPDTGSWELQAFADRALTEDAVAFRDDSRTVDVSLTHAPVGPAEHDLIWGVGYRAARSVTEATPLVRFTPDRRQLRWVSAFVQDEVALTPAWRLTAGLKLESNSYTGVEGLPTLRIGFVPDAGSTWWAGLSRAVRAPSRIDRDFQFPGKAPFLVKGGPDFRSETADIVEVGYRAQPSASLSYSVTAFHHQYRHLRAGGRAPTFIENKARGSVAGVEGWSTLELMPWWRLSGGFVELRKDLRADADAGTMSVENLGNDPKHQWMLRSSATLREGVELDAMARHVSALPSPRVPAYTALDVKLGWRLSPQTDLSLSARNLGGRHVEYGAGSEFGSSYWVSWTWRHP